MPALVAFVKLVIGNSTMATFAAFGSFAMLLLVDFGGPMRSRVQAQAALAVTGGLFICVGTLASGSAWLAAAAMGVVGFGVLFAGVVSSVLAGATNALLLAFILPVSLPGPASSIPDRLAGWGLAAAAALLAIVLLWPAPVLDPVRSAAIEACRALAARLRRDATTDDGAIERLHSVFFATPYRPTGLSTAARAVVRLVDELRWLDTIAQPPSTGAARDPAVSAVMAAAATALDRGADLLDRPQGPPQALRDAVAALRAAREALQHSVMRKLPVPATAGGEPVAEAPAEQLISSLDPSFRALELSFIVSQVAANIDLAAAAERRRWLDQVLGRRPAGWVGPLSTAQERAAAHVAPHSVWLQNSIRGAVGLSAAVLIARLTGVQHAFWVVLGTLSVLRSNALGTGQTALRGLGGTVVGLAVGGLLVALVGTHTTVLWLLLPVAVLLAGLAPATVSFAAGQAAFSLTLLILFNILAPAGWQIGLVRVEDVALGSAVSLGVGALFWPRGAGAELGRALADAYVASADYLAAGVRFGLRSCDSTAPSAPAPADEAVAAAAAARRLDDTFRTYLAERGAKPVPLAQITSLVTGIVALRLAADSVLDLWQQVGAPEGDRAAARRELNAGSESMTGWYADFAAGLIGRGDVPEPLPDDQRADVRLVDAVSADLRGEDGRATATAVRVIWTGDHLDAARRLQGMLVGPARAAVRQRALTGLARSSG
jgi:uncharacterized membrane protein YccC